MPFLCFQGAFFRKLCTYVNTIIRQVRAFHSETTEIKLKPDLSGKLRYYATGCCVAFVGTFLLKLGRNIIIITLIRNYGDKS